MENYITVEQLINMFHSLDEITTYELNEIDDFVEDRKLLHATVDYKSLFAKKYHHLKVVRFKYYEYDDTVIIEVKS